MAENENAESTESEDEQSGSSTVHSGNSASETYTGDDSDETIDMGGGEDEADGGGTITLQDFTLTDLDAADFTFHEEQQQDGI